ncbi:MAG: hypothetical protein R3Y52_01470 [Psittacicella sp.]
MKKTIIAAAILTLATTASFASNISSSTTNITSNTTSTVTVETILPSLSDFEAGTTLTAADVKENITDVDDLFKELAAKGDSIGEILAIYNSYSHSGLSTGSNNYGITIENANYEFADPVTISDNLNENSIAYGNNNISYINDTIIGNNNSLPVIDAAEGYEDSYRSGYKPENDIVLGSDNTNLFSSSIILGNDNSILPYLGDVENGTDTYDNETGSDQVSLESDSTVNYNDTIIGNNNNTVYNNNVIIGDNNTGTAANEVLLGNNVTTTEITNPTTSTNVYLGESLSGISSVATIHGVASGYTTYEAVNYGQLKTLIDDITSNTSEIANNSIALEDDKDAIFGIPQITISSISLTPTTTVSSTTVTTNNATVATNASSISKIALNTANITTNKIEIATNTKSIQTNTASIATNSSNIASNTARITTNTTNIANNTASITTNTKRIQSNTATISYNSKRIDNLYKYESINNSNLKGQIAMVTAETAIAYPAYNYQKNKKVQLTGGVGYGENQGESAIALGLQLEAKNWNVKVFTGINTANNSFQENVGVGAGWRF